MKQTLNERMSIIATAKQDVQHNFMLIGEQLSQLKSEKLFVQAGYKKFSDFVEHELGYPSSLASKLIRVWDVYANMGVQTEQMEEIGLEKLHTIMPVVQEAKTIEEKESWIEKAKTKTPAELKDDVRQAKKNAKPVIVSEQDEFVRDNLARLLESWNCSVQTMFVRIAFLAANTSDAALTKLRKRAKQAQIDWEVANAKKK